MTLITPITPTPASAIRHPSLNRAERLVACRDIVVEMLTNAASHLYFAQVMSPDFKYSILAQARIRMTGAALLLSELHGQGEDVGRTIMSEIIATADTQDADMVRGIAARLNAAFDIELHQVELGMLYDRYA